MFARQGKAFAHVQTVQLEDLVEQSLEGESTLVGVGHREQRSQLAQQRLSLGSLALSRRSRLTLGGAAVLDAPARAPAAYG